MKKIKTFFRKVWFWSKILVPVIAITAFISIVPFRSSTVMAEVPEVKIIDKTPEKIEKLKSDVVDRILACESAGRSESDGLVVFDTTAARALATEVIFDTDRGLSNWLNCANKLNLAPEVAVIKNLSK